MFADLPRSPYDLPTISLCMQVHVLKPPSDALTSSWQLVTHYSRDIQCAGVHAWGRLHLAFAALVEHLVRLLDVRPTPSPAHAPPHPTPPPHATPPPHGAPPRDAISDGPPGSELRSPRPEMRSPTAVVPLHSLWSMRCLLHMDVRSEDLEVPLAVGLLPTMSLMVRILHGLDGDSAGVGDGRSQPGAPQPAHSQPAHSRHGGASERYESRRLPRAFQLVQLTLVSRCFDASHQRGAALAPPASLARASSSRGRCVISRHLPPSLSACI